MADKETQTGGEEQRREGLGSSLVNEQEALTGVSNGDQKEIVITPPAPVAATTTPKTTDGATAVAPPVQGAAGEEEPDPRAQRSDTTVPPQQAPQTTPTTPKADDAPAGDEYSRDRAKANAAAAAAAAEEEEIRDTKKMRQLLNDKWGLQWPDPVLHNIMQKGSVTKGMGGIVFELEEGSTIKWHENFMQQGEFIGKTGFFKSVTEKDAEAIVAIAKNRGWTKIAVYGNREQKEMFWLEAKKQGMEVGNFVPMADSPILQKWAQVQQELADKTLAGVQNGDNAPLEVKGEVKPGADERPGYRSSEPATEETPKAADAPKTVADSAIAGKLVATPAAVSTEPAAGAPVAETATAAAVVETVATSTTPKGADAIKQYFDARISEVTHPKMKEGLARICTKLSADGVDEAVVQQVCEKLGPGRVLVKNHNDAVAFINEKLPSADPLIEMGFKPQARNPQRLPK